MSFIFILDFSTRALVKYIYTFFWEVKNTNTVFLTLPTSSKKDKGGEE